MKKLYFKILDFTQIKFLRLNQVKVFQSPKRICFDDNFHYFFGYYDKCPWDYCEKFFLFLRTEFASRMPKTGDEAEIGFVDLRNGKKEILGSTKAWSWQQGNMLQWFGEKQVIFNSFQKNRYVTVIKSIQKKENEMVFPRPIYCIDKKKEKGLSLNFDRLHYARPGYGYVEKTNFSKTKYPDNDGIWKIDFKTKEENLIISLEMIVKMFWKEEFKDAFHWFNHLEFNPSGNRFVFFHRWKNNKNQRRTRMFTADENGKDIFCLADYGMVSHFCWRDDYQLVAWADHPSFGKQFYRFFDKTQKVQPVNMEELKEDGHPSYSPNKRWLLIDTYPDRKGLRSLILYDEEKKEKRSLGEFYSPYVFRGPIRCDLHPRWNRDGTKISFDSTHEGRRGIYEIDISETIKVKGD